MIFSTPLKNINLKTIYMNTQQNLYRHLQLTFLILLFTHLSKAQSNPPVLKPAIKKVSLQGPFSSYFSKLQLYKIKISGSSAQILATQTNAVGKSEVGVSLPQAANSTVVNGSPSAQREGNAICETQGYLLDHTNAGLFNTLERALPTTIFPGAFLNAQTILSKRPAAYNAPNRSPLTIAISINDQSDIKTFTAANFGSTYEQELHAQLRNTSFGTSIPAFILSKITEVSSEVELRAKLNMTVGVMVPLEEFGIPVEISNGISGGASVSGSRKLRTYIITYEQPMYDYTVKENDRNLFFSTPNSAAQHTNAVLVRSVIYGRRVLIVVKSQEDEATVSTTVRQRLGISLTGTELAGFTLGSKIDGSILTKFSQQIKSFTAMVQGGNPALANKVISDPNAIKGYFEDPNAAILRANTGEVPIQYVLERVSADAVIGVRSTANFNAEFCVEPTYKIEVIYKGIKCYKVVEAPFDDKEDVFGSASVNGKSVVSIPENDAVSIKGGETKSDQKIININSNITLGQLIDYALTFSTNLKDWEPLHKPEFELDEPIEGKYIINNNRLNTIVGIQPGQSKVLDGQREVRLYENGETSNASIAVLYQVRVTRN
jgi:hypothetical protein